MNKQSGAPLQLYLIRHGETNWSLSGQHTGRTDIPLTEHGEQQARGLTLALRDISFAHIFSSPRQRARQTCELSGLGVLAEIEPDLDEWDYGDYEKLRSDDIYKQHPNWNVFRDGCPNGEMPQQVATRADRLIARLNKLEGNVALFSHGHFGAVLATRWIEFAIEEAAHFPLSTASISILNYDARHNDIAVIASWNSTAHVNFDPSLNISQNDPLILKKRVIDRWENEGGELQNQHRSRLPEVK
tara:strand:- start:211250 stop:211981 length:732 start_codon:yes stop_codon:yes gene_type:complete